MMYVEYPELTEEERLENLTTLNFSQVFLNPMQALSYLDTDLYPTAISLANVLGRPAYQFELSTKTSKLVFADNGALLTQLSDSQALIAVQESGFYDSDYELTYDRLIEVDQWTLTTSLNSFRPLHKVRLHDDAGTILYISDVTGRVVRDTNRKEMFWNWLGSTIHWIYPTILRKNVDIWIQVIICVSLLGIASVVSGGIIGVMRLRVRNPYRDKNISPYLGVMKLHHILGLFSIVFVSTFIFSGLMSMGPWRIFESSNSFSAQTAGYTGGSSLNPSELPQVAELPENIVAKEVTWHSISGAPYLVSARSAFNKSSHMEIESKKDQSLILLAKITEAIPNLIPTSKMSSLELIREYDDYYYSRHNRYRPLPVFRAKFDDEESTWFHINLNTGEIVNRLTKKTRLERWIYNGLHSLDFQFLWERRPIWDTIVILLSVIGLVFSLTSLVIGSKRLLLSVRKVKSI